MLCTDAIAAARVRKMPAAASTDKMQDPYGFVQRISCVWPQELAINAAEGCSLVSLQAASDYDDW